MRGHILAEAFRSVTKGRAAPRGTPGGGHLPARPALSLAWSKRQRSPRLSSAEHDAILAGVFAGEIAIEGSHRTGVLKLFVRHAETGSADAKLEALRAYAELRRVFLDQDIRMPAASLSAAGFTDAQVAKFDAVIVAWPGGE